MEKKTKKPFYKRWWVWVIAVMVVVAAIQGVTGIGRTGQTVLPPSESTAPATETQALAMTSEPATATPSPENVVETEDLQTSFNASLSDGAVLFSKEVNNDVTGKWRLLRYASGESIVDHASDYFNAYFLSDDEVHVVVNFTLGTTSVLTVNGNTMFIAVHEYIEKEEHDAKVLAGGKLLGSYIVNLSTGEAELLTDD